MNKSFEALRPDPRAFQPTIDAFMDVLEGGSMTVILIHWCSGPIKLEVQ